jgi:hypothetical protein
MLSSMAGVVDSSQQLSSHRHSSRYGMSFAASIKVQIMLSLPSPPGKLGKTLLRASPRLFDLCGPSRISKKLIEFS